LHAFQVVFRQHQKGISVDLVFLERRQQALEQWRLPAMDGRKARRPSENTIEREKND
jgi:hypothetical protein